MSHVVITYCPSLQLHSLYVKIIVPSILITFFFLNIFHCSIFSKWQDLLADNTDMPIFQDTASGWIWDEFGGLQVSVVGTFISLNMLSS